MADLLTLTDARALLRTDLDDAALGVILDREEARLKARLGAHGDGASAITEYVDATGGDLFVSRPFVSITTINGAAPGSAYIMIGDQGRVAGGSWCGTIAVVYVPQDDRPARRQALVDLTRLAIERTAMASESVAGEYSYTAPDWEAARAAIYRRLMFTSV